MSKKILSEEEKQYIAKLISDNRGLFIRNIMKLEAIISQEDVEDCLQELYILAYENYDALIQSPNPIGWLFQTLKNITNNYRRKKIKRLNYLPLSDFDNEKYFEDNENNMLFRIMTNHFSDELIISIIFSKLSEKEKLLYSMRYTDKLSSKDIAKKLNVSDILIRVNLHNLKKKIKTIIYSDDLIKYIKEFEKDI